MQPCADAIASVGYLDGEELTVVMPMVRGSMVQKSTMIVRTLIVLPMTVLPMTVFMLLLPMLCSFWAMRSSWTMHSAQPYLLGPIKMACEPLLTGYGMGKQFLCDWPDCGKHYDRPAKLEEHKQKHTNTVDGPVCVGPLSGCRGGLAARSRGAGRPLRGRPTWSATAGLCTRPRMRLAGVLPAKSVRSALPLHTSSSGTC